MPTESNDFLDYDPFDSFLCADALFLVFFLLMMIV